LAASSGGRIGMAAKAVVYAVAAVSCWAATPALLTLACISHPRYGTGAAAYCTAVGPSQALACTAPNSADSSPTTAA